MQSLRVPAFPEVACYYYEIGNKDRAVELLELALKSLDGHGAKKSFNQICCRPWPTTSAKRFVTAMFSWFRGRMFQAVPRRRLSRRTRLKEALLNDFSLRGALLASSR